MGDTMRLYSRSISKDIEIRLKLNDGNLERIYFEIIIMAKGTKDKWMFKHLEREAQEIHRMAREADRKEKEKCL